LRAFLCDRRGNVYEVQVTDTNAILNQPFATANLTIKVLGNLLIERDAGFCVIAVNVPDHQGSRQPAHRGLQGQPDGGGEEAGSESRRCCKRQAPAGAVAKTRTDVRKMNARPGRCPGQAAPVSLCRKKSRDV
jgi:hypothetical protein